MKLISLISLIAFLGVTSSSAAATAMDVGTGENSAGLYIEWSDGCVAEFLVNFDEPTVSGLGLFDTVEAYSSLTTLRSDFGFGVFIDGITYNAHSNVGYAGGEDWWHYWVKRGDADWVSPPYGASDRVVSSGDMDGWIYGRAGTVPEPSTLLLLCLGGLLVRRARAKPDSAN